MHGDLSLLVDDGGHEKFDMFPVDKFDMEPDPGRSACLDFAALDILPRENILLRQARAGNHQFLRGIVHKVLGAEIARSLEIGRCAHTPVVVRALHCAQKAHNSYLRFSFATNSVVFLYFTTKMVTCQVLWR